MQLKHATAIRIEMRFGLAVLLMLIRLPPVVSDTIMKIKKYIALAVCGRIIK